MFDIVSVFALVAASANVYGSVVSLNQLHKGLHYRLYLFSSLVFILGTLYWIFSVFALYPPSLDLARVGVIFFIFSNMFVLLAAETLKREQVEPVKLTAYLELSTITIMLLYFLSDTISFTLDASGGYRISFNILIGFLLLLGGLIPLGYYFYCIFLVNKQAPVPLKRYSRIYFGGVILALIGAIVSLLPSLQYATIVESLGLVIIVYSFSREPKLLFVLPFTALRLSVLDTVGGLPLFSHTWNRQSNLIDEDLFSGILQGISGVLKESVNQGDVQEIHLANGIIIAYRYPGYPVAFVLVATRPSRTLRESLKLFAKQFCEIFHVNFSHLNNIGQFRNAEDLITTCFPHVPVYN